MEAALWYTAIRTWKEGAAVSNNVIELVEGSDLPKRIKKYLQAHLDPGEAIISHDTRKSAMRSMWGQIKKSRYLNRIVFLLFGLTLTYAGVMSFESSIIAAVITVLIGLPIIYVSLPVLIPFRTTYYIITDERMFILVDRLFGKIKTQDIQMQNVTKIECRKKAIVIITPDEEFVIKPADFELITRVARTNFPSITLDE